MRFLNLKLLSLSLMILLIAGYASIVHANTPAPSQATSTEASEAASTEASKAANSHISPIKQCIDIISDKKYGPTTQRGKEHDITLEVCIYKALLENHLIKASFHNIAARRELIRKAESVRFGKLSFNIFASKFNDSMTDFIGKEQSAARNLNLDIPIYAGGSIKSARNKAILASKIAGYQSAQTIQEVASQTIGAYLNLLQSQWLIDVGEQYLRQLDLQLKLIEDRVKAGVAVKSDRLTVVVARNEAKLLLIYAKNLRKRSIAALNLVMAGRLQRELTAIPPTNLEVMSEPLKKGLERAQKKRPELLAARAGLSIFREELVTARAKLKPEIGLNVVYGDLSPIFSGETDSTQLTLAGTFPLYQGGGLRADVHNALNTVKEQEERLLFYEQSSDFEVTQAHIDMAEASERITIAVDNISSAKENARIVEERYKSGSAIVLEMVDANVALLSAKTDVLKTLIGYFTASADYYRTSGDISKFFNKDLRAELEKRSPKFGKTR